MAKLCYQLCCYSLSSLIVSACAELAQTDPLTVAGLTFHNATSTPIHDARLSVRKTHGLVACGVVLPHNECSTTFPLRQYQGNAITVSWQHAGQAWTSANVPVQLPEYPIPNRPTTAVVTLGENGSIIVRLIQPPADAASTMSLQPE
jgi:hypothetical protein